MPLRTNAQAGKSAEAKAAKASQSTMVLKPAGAAKVSTVPKDPRLVNPISQVADVQRHEEYSQSEKSKQLCMSEPLDRTML